jgi:hypothetical protein
VRAAVSFVRKRTGSAAATKGLGKPLFASIVAT